MEKWQYLLIRVLRSLEMQEHVLTPPQPDVGAALHGVGPESTVALLDALGDAGWELVAVDPGSGGYWMKRRKAGD
jgi:hypothetical protein